MNRGIGCCFAEVEVDTWTGDYRYVRAAYCHDAGHVNESVAGERRHARLTGAEHGRWRPTPFRGTGNFREPALCVGYLSYRLPTIMEPPDTTNVFINSLEPRWFFGSKGFAETCDRSASRRVGQCHLQCLRRAHPGASDYEGRESWRA